MTLLIFYIALALGVSFLCSIMEAVLLSIPASYVAARSKTSTSIGRQLQDLKQNVDRPLAAILSLNTIAHTVGAAGAGAQAVRVFGDAFAGVIMAVLTLLILVLSEIIPKTLGALYWRRLTTIVVRILVPTIWLMYPLVALAKGIMRMLSRAEDEKSVSRRELTALADLGTEEGVFEPEESRILKNLLRFGELRVSDVMTPRMVLFALPEEQTIDAVLEENETLRFSRIPVYVGSRDNITGYVLKDEILLRAAQDRGDGPLSEIRREIHVVPDSLLLPDLFEQLLDRREAIALAADEYGGTDGIVTLEDVVETLLGLEIMDEADSVEDMQLLARQQWIKRAQRLGLVSEDLDEAAEREAITRLGLTGGQAFGPHKPE